MDLLNSILNSMDAPPSANEQQKKMLKKQREMEERLRKKQKDELVRFRKYVEDRLNRFAKDDRTHIEFQPLDKIHRSIIAELAEFGGFLTMSFGREDIDRYSVVYKKENPPSEDEIAARRNGDGWNEQIAKEYAEMRQQKEQEEFDNELKRLARASAAQRNAADAGPSAGRITSNNNNNNNNPGDESTSERKPTSNYKDKYAHLIGQEAALEAARKTETNQSYGFVPSKNKKDVRSIEQTLADIQAKKRRKLEEQQRQQQQQTQPQFDQMVNVEQEQQQRNEAQSESTANYYDQGQAQQQQQRQ